MTIQIFFLFFYGIKLHKLSRKTQYLIELCLMLFGLYKLKVLPLV